MSKFALKEIEIVVGRIKFYKLVDNGKCHYDEFVNNIEREGNFIDQLNTIISRMDDIANLRMLPKNKYRQIGAKGNFKQFEIKTRDLRLYLIKEHLTGNIIFIGGKKNSQKGDIKKFNAILDSYQKDNNEK